MRCYRVSLTPVSAFVTPMKGDTLFGQLCWAIRNRFGESLLNELLTGYGENRPFAVLSDVFPKGYFPFPSLPSSYYDQPIGEDAKSVKESLWLPETILQSPLQNWLQQALSPYEIAFGVESKPAALQQTNVQSHKAVSDKEHGGGDHCLSVYGVEQQWFSPDVEWALYLLLDTDRISLADCRQCLEDIGNFGFGKDASIGLGKFELLDVERYVLSQQADTNACMTLAPSAPQGLGIDPQHCFYRVFTRFGRHGDIAAHQAVSPFKNPVLLAQTAAVFAVNPPATGFIGQGIGGRGELSKAIKSTVHQGYAPIVSIRLGS